jgi:hypothetical protein
MTVVYIGMPNCNSQVAGLNGGIDKDDVGEADLTSF